MNGANHDLQLVGIAEVAYLLQASGIVGEAVHLQAIIQSAEMLPHDADGFIHTLLDGDGRHHYHKLAEAISFVQLVDGAQVHVGLARAGLHFHGEMPAIRLDFAGHLDAVALLNGL